MALCNTAERSKQTSNTAMFLRAKHVTYIA